MIYLIANLNLSDLKLLFPKTDPRTIQTGQLCQPCFEICQKKETQVLTPLINGFAGIAKQVCFYQSKKSDTKLIL